MTEQEFGKVVDFLEGAWGVQLSGKQRDAYWLLLRESQAGAVMAEAVRLARSARSRYGLPKPGELLGADDEAPGILAWHTLVRAIERHGHYDSVEFEDGALGACVEALGGWLAVSEWPLGDEREMRFLQRDFERLYGALSRRGGAGPKRFIGQIEKHNAGRFPEYVPGVVCIPSLSSRPRSLAPLALPGPESDDNH